MNTRSNTFEFNCEENQVNELVSTIIHSIFFYRSYGKFNYSKESFKIGSVGYEEIFCNYIDFTYVRCNSPTLNENLEKNIKDFITKFKQQKINKKGIITLEFYTKKSKIIPMLSFYDDNLIWEQWIIKINCVKNNEINNENLSEILLEKLMYIITLANNQDLYMPELPQEILLDTCFDCSHPDILPYLYRITTKFIEKKNSSSDLSSNNEGTLKQFIKEMIK